MFTTPLIFFTGEKHATVISLITRG